jgi:hypothetical protein
MAGAQSNRTHCPRGHEYDAANTRIDHRGSRVCRACRRARYAESRAPRPTLAEIIWTRFDRSDGCWVWNGAPMNTGYGQYRNRLAHRLVYELLVGPIPESLTLDHLCRNRICVNPAHLEPVTFKENVLRGESLPARNARKTHCPQGHPYDEENTYVSPRGWRQCRTCIRERMRRMR